MVRPSLLVATSLLALIAGVAVARAQGEREKLNGYLEWRLGDVLIIEGQRVVPATKTKFKGKGEATSVAAIPLGYIVEVQGRRRANGLLEASRIVAKPHGTQLFEEDVKAATDQLEAAYREAGQFLMAAGNETASLGELEESGPRVERVRRIVDRLLPPYLDRESVRVYVIVNPEWNAMAMGNFSIYVFSGLMEAVDDDELAIVLGHEIAHATHEHTRRQHKTNMWVQIGAASAAVAIGTELDGGEEDVAVLLAGLGAVAFSNGYSRDHEDQADRVGMRYAYEGGFDVSKGPRLWEKFAEKYGDSDLVTNFLFGDHSRSSVRAQDLQREISRNYGDGRKSVARR